MIDQRPPVSAFVRSGAVILGCLSLSACASWFSGPASFFQSDLTPLPLQAAHIGEETNLVAARAQTVQHTATRYVVKVKDGEAEALSRLYFRDPGAARASFNDWAADKPVFRDLDLVAGTYSGELILEEKAAANRSLGTRSAGSGVLAALREHPMVAYADPDYVAQTQDGYKR